MHLEEVQVQVNSTVFLRFGSCIVWHSIRVFTIIFDELDECFHNMRSCRMHTDHWGGRR